MLGGRVPDHLGDKEIGDSCGARAAGTRVAQIVSPEGFNPTISGQRRKLRLAESGMFLMPARVFNSGIQ